LSTRPFATIRRVALVAALALTAAGTSTAGSGSSYFDVVDTDRNNRISLDEYIERFTFAFRKMDSNHDSILQPREQLVPNGPTVTLLELKHRLEKQFHRQDKDKNGWLSAREFLAPPA
jgi:EF hand